MRNLLVLPRPGTYVSGREGTKVVRRLWCVLLLAGLSANAQAQFDLEAEPLPEIVAEMVSNVGAVIAPCPEVLGLEEYEHVCAYFDSSYSSDWVRRDIDSALLFRFSRQIIQPWTDDEFGFALVIAIDENERGPRETVGMSREELMDDLFNPRPSSKMVIGAVIFHDTFDGRGLLLFFWVREQ